MPPGHSPFIDKAQESLRAAQILMEQGLNDSAVNRAYYAMFHAARAALISSGTIGATQKLSHEAVQSLFPTLGRRRKLYPAQLASDLASVRARRLIADYEMAVVSSREARDVVTRSSNFVALVNKQVSQ